MIKMTDSDDDLLESYQYSFANEGMAIRAKGPNIDFETISLPSSTMQMLPGNVNRPKYGHGNNGQRSLYYRRETSPMSAYNVSHFSRPYNRSLSTRSHIGSHQSVYNRGNRSPASVRSLDSTASVTASDIVVALKNEHFNKYDQKLLKAACYKFLKNKSRKRLEYMRNRRILMNKVRRRRSIEDLGEMASESSSNSEHSISPKICKPKDTNGKIIKNNLHQPCIENDYTNILDMNRDQNINEDAPIVATPASKMCTNTSKENSFLLKDRFKKGFLLPSQRFSSSNGPTLTETKSCNSNKNQVPDLIRQCSRDITENNSDEEIFSVPTNKGADKTRTASRKRTIDSNEQEDNPKASKQMKTGTPKKPENLNPVNNAKNDFDFARPQMPVTKLGKLKKKKAQPEILISKSAQPVSILNETAINTLSPIHKENIHESTKVSDDINNLDRNSINNEYVNTNDISKRPSFIKRKLFTQKLDLIEAKIDTPQSSPLVNKYVSNKEKTKPRKLASSQSCLSRDVAEDNNNLLNLLHKIVPVEQMSLINSTTNKTDSGNRKSEGECAKWDIDSVLSTCNAEDGSETYTDEEILVNENNQKRNSNENPQNILSSNVEISQKHKTSETNSNVIKDGNENAKKTNQKSFWDTDIESDWENNVFLPYKLNNCQSSKATVNQHTNKNENNKNIPVNSSAKNTTKCLKVDAIKKVANNCQQSIWDTDFESDLESYGILPKKAGNSKTNNATAKKNINNEENCESTNVPVNSRTKKNNSKFVNIDVNKTVANNYQKSIWDTDFESDLESCGILPQATKASKTNTTVTAKKRVNKEEKFENNNGIVNTKTKHVNKTSQKVDAIIKPANNPKSIWDTDFESELDLSNKSGICKTNSTAIEENGSNKENIEGKRIMIIKCQRLNTITNVTGLKLVSQSTEPDSKNNKPITNKRIKKDDNVKVNSPVNKTKLTATKRTPTKCDQDKNGKLKKPKEIQKQNNSPELDNNVSNVSGRWLRANRRANNSINDLKAKDNLKTALISHRMTRQKTKLLKTSDLTSSTIQSDVSELNISVRSLRPRKKRVTKW